MNSDIKPEHTTDIMEDVREMIEEVTESIGNDAWSCRVEEIESKSRDGFIAFTDGGWNGCVTFGFHQEVSWVVDQIKPFVERDQIQMFDQFLEERGALGEVIEPRQPDAEPNWELVDQHPEWEEFRDGWGQEDDTAWFVYVRAIFYDQDNHRNVSGEDEFQFCLGINDDFNYGRDSISWCKGGSTWVWERNVAVSEITPELLAEIQREFLEAWSNA